MPRRWNFMSVEYEGVVDPLFSSVIIDLLTPAFFATSDSVKPVRFRNDSKSMEFLFKLPPSFSTLLELSPLHS